jgi:hypothetical protein
MAPTANPSELEGTSPPDYVHHWVKKLNLSDQTASKLRGGANNHVYLCGSGANTYIVKGYQIYPPGTRNRMQSEVEFLRFAAELAQEFVPRLIEVDWQRRCIVMEHISGENYTDGYVPAENELELAYEFARRINSDRKKAEKFITMNAADGYMRLTEHLKDLSIRVGQLRIDHLPVNYQEPATTLVENIRIKIENIATQTNDQIRSGKINDAVQKKDLCISPSDFGFHNAIRTRYDIKFIDFEFSGWDDPAKMIADFVLQPRVPVKHFPPGLIKIFHPDSAQATLERCAILGPILRIKWLCIILSILNPIRLSKFLEIHRDVVVETLIKQRLQLATNYLYERTPFGIY